MKLKLVFCLRTCDNSFKIKLKRIFIGVTPPFTGWIYFEIFYCCYVNFPLFVGYFEILFISRIKIRHSTTSLLIP